MESPSLDNLCKILGVQIEPALLEQALTHRSFAYENGGIADNERLEFLGDTVLGRAVTVLLFHEFPDESEGELAKRRSRLVSTAALEQIARQLGLGDYLRLGNGEELTGGRQKASLLADTMEAIFGAAYLSAGTEASEELVRRLVSPLLAEKDRFGAAMDPKTSLQELVAKLGRPAPRYQTEGTGPDHDRIFQAMVFLDSELIAEGSGSSKKQAELAAALCAWKKLSNA